MTKSGDELTKNRREDDEGFEGGMIFEKPGSQRPVASLEFYIKHLNPKNECVEMYILTPVMVVIHLL